MKRIAVVFWSGTGNTETMPLELCKGISLAGGIAVPIYACDFSSSMVRGFDAFALGCPNFGREGLEELEFEPVFSSLEREMEGKAVCLFGSYGWDGEWIKAWENRCIKAGACIACPSVVCIEEPDSNTLKLLRETGRRLFEIA